MKFLNIPASISCSRLLINDTAAPTSELSRLAASLPAADIVAIGRDELADRIRADVGMLVDRADTALLPGSSARICADALSPVPASKLLQISVSRRLVGLAPRGLDMRPDAELTLSSLSGSYVVIDDVIASGTTVNGIVKRTKGATVSACAVLAVRERNDLRAGMPVIAGACVGRPSAGYARINTLGTLTQA